MDWDEVRPRAGQPIAVGDHLALLSVAELETRIEVLEKEIERVKAELKAKRAHEEAAAKLFKR
jgi:uncharacterized small protein (DUF1192 family)